jgi:hypothetical protein
MKRIFDEDDEEVQQQTFIIFCAAAVTLNQRSIDHWCSIT